MNVSIEGCGFAVPEDEPYDHILQEIDAVSLIVNSELSGLQFPVNEDEDVGSATASGIADVVAGKLRDLKVRVSRLFI